jgi:peptide/nickel transport system permease protein
LTGKSARRERWGQYWRRLKRRPVSLIGIIVFLGFIALAVFGPWIAPYSFTEQVASLRLLPPSLAHPFGTDPFGRDVLSRVIIGTRTVVLISGLGTLFAVLIGSPLGMFSGYIGGVIDEVIMRLLDVFLSIPSLLLALVLLSTLGPSSRNLLIVLTVLYSPMVARVVRSMTLDLKNKEFVEAARVRGDHTSYILFREIFPGAIAPLLVEASMRFSYAIFLVASLGFLGLGVQPPAPDWGLLISQARDFFTLAPWTLLFPAAAIGLLVVSVNLTTDGLRQMLQPERGGL